MALPSFASLARLIKAMEVAPKVLMNPDQVKAVNTALDFIKSYKPVADANRHLDDDLKMPNYIDKKYREALAIVEFVEAAAKGEMTNTEFGALFLHTFRNLTISEPAAAQRIRDEYKAVLALQNGPASDGDASTTSFVDMPTGSGPADSRGAGSGSAARGGSSSAAAATASTGRAQATAASSQGKAQAARAAAARKSLARTAAFAEQDRRDSIHPYFPDAAADEVLYGGDEDDDEAGSSSSSSADAAEEPIELVLRGSRGAQAVVNKFFNRYLKDYQREGVQWMFDRLTRASGCILGDDMGLGKTIQTAALISALLGKSGVKERDDALRKSEINRRAKNGYRPPQLPSPDDGTELGTRPDEQRPILVLAPVAVLANWVKEIKKWTWLTVMTLNDCSGREDRECLIADANAGVVEVVICGYELAVGSCNELLCGVPWGLVVMDEVHRIKNPKTKGYKALVPLPSFRRLGLTGTPMQNNLMELFYVLDQVSPGCAGEAGDFKIKYAANVKHHHDRTPLEALEAEGAIKELQLAIIKPNILMRKKSNVLAHLLPTKTELAVLCKMGTIQEKVYQRATSYVDFRYVSMCAHHRKQEKGAYFEQPGTIWAQQNRHRDENTPGVLKACDKCPGCMLFSMIHICMKLANHVELLKSKVEGSDDFRADRANDFLQYALQDFRGRNDDYAAVGGLTETNKHDVLSNPALCGKMTVLAKLIDRAAEHNRNVGNISSTEMQKLSKVIVFSRSLKLLDCIQNFLCMKYPLLRYNGGMTKKERQAVEKTFNEDRNIFVMLMTVGAGSVGLNLTAANVVVLFDPHWNPAVDAQAQDRAFRIGQTRDVTVYRLLSSGTIDEAIYMRQLYKSQLAGWTLDNDNSARIFNQRDVSGGASLITYHPDKLEFLMSRYRDSVSKDGLLELEIDVAGVKEELEAELGSAGLKIKEEKGAVKLEERGSSSSSSSSGKSSSSSSSSSALTPGVVPAKARPNSSSSSSRPSSSSSAATAAGDTAYERDDDDDDTSDDDGRGGGGGASGSSSSGAAAAAAAVASTDPPVDWATAGRRKRGMKRAKEADEYGEENDEIHDEEIFCFLCLQERKAKREQQGQERRRQKRRALQQQQEEEQGEDGDGSDDGCGGGGGGDDDDDDDEAQLFDVDAPASSSSSSSSAAPAAPSASTKRAAAAARLHAGSAAVPFDEEGAHRVEDAIFDGGGVHALHHRQFVQHSGYERASTKAAIAAQKRAEAAYAARHPDQPPQAASGVSSGTQWKRQKAAEAATAAAAAAAGDDDDEPDGYGSHDGDENFNGGEGGAGYFGCPPPPRRRSSVINKFSPASFAPSSSSSSSSSSSARPFDMEDAVARLEAAGGDGGRMGPAPPASLMAMDDDPAAAAAVPVVVVAAVVAVRAPVPVAAAAAVAAAPVVEPEEPLAGYLTCDFE